MITKHDLDKILRPLYYDVGSDAAFSSASKLYRAARLESAEITLSQVKNWLSQELTYTLHKQPRWRFPRAQCLVSAVDEQWQADLADMQTLSRSNSGYKYILTVIDMFSKYAFAVPIKNKYGKTLCEVFKNIFEQRFPTKLQTDQGTEFDNQQLKAYLKKMRIHYFTTTDRRIKCAVVERFNRTLKSKLFKYMTSRGTKRWLDVLPQILDVYNRTVHRTTRMRPVDVRTDNKHDQSRVFLNTYGYGSLRELLLARRYGASKFKAGTKVRAIKLRSKFQKGYVPAWTETIYTIKKVIRRGRDHVYELVDDNNRPKRKKYYAQELQAASQRDTMPYKVLKSRVRSGNRQLLIEFPGRSGTTLKGWIDSNQVPVI